MDKYITISDVNLYLDLVKQKVVQFMSKGLSFDLKY